MNQLSYTSVSKMAQGSKIAENQSWSKVPIGNIKLSLFGPVKRKPLVTISETLIQVNVVFSPSCPPRSLRNAFGNPWRAIRSLSAGSMNQFRVAESRSIPVTSRIAAKVPPS